MENDGKTCVKIEQDVTIPFCNYPALLLVSTDFSRKIMTFNPFYITG